MLKSLSSLFRRKSSSSVQPKSSDDQWMDTFKSQLDELNRRVDEAESRLLREQESVRVKQRKK